MSDWSERIARLAALGERVTALTDTVKSPAKRVEDHQGRLIRLQTIVETTRPADGATLRITPPKD